MHQEPLFKEQMKQAAKGDLGGFKRWAAAHIQEQWLPAFRNDSDQQSVVVPATVLVSEPEPAAPSDAACSSDQDDDEDDTPSDNGDAGVGDDGEEPFQPSKRMLNATGKLVHRRPESTRRARAPDAEAAIEDPVAAMDTVSKHLWSGEPLAYGEFVDVMSSQELDRFDHDADESSLVFPGDSTPPLSVEPEAGMGPTMDLLSDLDFSFIDSKRSTTQRYENSPELAFGDAELDSFVGQIASRDEVASVVPSSRKRPRQAPTRPAAMENTLLMPPVIHHHRSRDRSDDYAGARKNRYYIGSDAAESDETLRTSGLMRLIPLSMSNTGTEADVPSVIRIGASDRSFLVVSSSGESDKSLERAVLLSLMWDHLRVVEALQRLTSSMNQVMQSFVCCNQVQVLVDQVSFACGVPDSPGMLARVTTCIQEMHDALTVEQAAGLNRLVSSRDTDFSRLVDSMHDNVTKILIDPRERLHPDAYDYFRQFSTAALYTGTSITPTRDLDRINLLASLVHRDRYHFHAPVVDRLTRRLE